MGRIRTIARRTFLVGSAAIAGGVAFGAYKLNQTPPNPFAGDTEFAALNPFIVIDKDGVTIITPRAEMGQGVYTTLAALAAEELDLAWEDVRVLHGPPAKAYYNSALMAGALPGAEYNMSNFKHGFAKQIGKVGKLFDLQVTGGSTSMKDGYERLRHAGASARETLKLAAADQLGLPVTDLRTEEGHVIAPDGTRLSYVSLAEAAAQIDPPSVDLRPKSEWKLLGKTLPRLDMLAKATGTAEFGIDVRLPGMKFATVRMNPKRGDSMVRFDATEAEKMPGVEKIIDLGAGIAVVASNTWLAIQAAEAVDIEWSDAPYPDDTDAMFDAIAASFDGKANSTMRDDGDVDTAIDGGTVITAEYKMPFLAHATMEPMNATALYTGDRLDIWCGTQGPGFTRDKAAAIVGLEPDAVKVTTTLLGGGFGRRGEMDFSNYAAMIAKEMKDTPVQVTWSREEDMRNDFFRPAALARYSGVVKDGQALTLAGKVAGPSVAASSLGRLMGFAPGGPDKEHVAGAFDQPYKIPNHRIEGYLTDLAVPLGFWRSVGASVNAFMYDSFVDEMAHAAGADPLAFRLAMAQDEHMPSAKVLEAVRDMSGWTGQTPDNIGRGVAFSLSFGMPVAQVIEVEDKDGEIVITKAWIACDPGVALDPGNLQAQLMGGMMYGLSAAAYGEITFAEGEAEQLNFPDYDAMRMHTAPAVEVKILENNPHITGAGEPGTPPSMPALANALFDLTKQRARELPLIKQFDLRV